MAKVVTTFVSDDKAMAASIAKMNADMAKMREEHKKLSDETANGSKKVISAIEDGASSAIASYGSVAGAIALVNSSLERRIELEGKVATLQRDAARDQRRLRLNLGDLSAQDQEAAEKGLERVSEKLKMPMSKLSEGFGATLSGTAGDVTKALEIVEKAGALGKGLDAETSQISLSLSNLQKATGGDVDRAQSLLVSTGKNSNLADWNAIATNGTKAILAARKYGFTEEGAAGLFSAMTQSTGGDMGNMEATATANFVQQLEAEFPEKDVFKVVNGKRKKIASGVGKMTGDERMEALMRDPQRLEDFKNNMTGEALAVPSMKELLTPGSPAFTNYLKFREETKANLDNPNFVGNFVEGLNRGPLQAGMADELNAERVSEDSKRRNTKAAYRARVRSTLDEALDDSFEGPVTKTLKMKGFDFATSFMGADPADRASSEVQERLLRINRPGGDMEAVQTLREVLEVLKEMKDNQRTSKTNANVEGR